jgi:hypothetical protein
MEERLSRPESRPGRGAPENPVPTRFGLATREADGDWLDQRDEHDGEQPLRTTVTVEQPRSIIARNQSPDVGFDRSINPYRGCEHGCIYCFARPTHAFHDLSPGLDFETKLFAKPNAAQLLRAELGKPGYVCRPMALGTNTDPYQPIEGKWRHHAIRAGGAGRDAAPRHHHHQVGPGGARHRHPCADGGAALANVAISVTSLTPEVSRTLEPRAPAARKRLAA